VGVVAVPRYYFHFSDGKRTFSDATGVDLTGIAPARSHAATQIREIRGAISEQNIQDWVDWKMVVVDAGGETVFEIGFDLKPRKW
jgi:hypothetical protein